MYSVGSLFYAIYFFVSFPMFFRMDEDTKVPYRWLGWLAGGRTLGCLHRPPCLPGTARRPGGNLSLVASTASRPADVPDQRPSLQAKPYTLWRTAVDALAAGMLVTCLLDFWRIGLGGIVAGGAGSGGLPWMSA